MRLIRITTNYSSYLNQFYVQHPELKDQPYHIQYQELMADCFAWADFWTHALSKLGYEVWEPVGNAEWMQKTWARENNSNCSEKNWLTDILAAQIKHYKPDILFVDDYITYQAEWLQNIRQENPSIKLVFGWCGAPYSDGSVFSAYDLVLSNIPSFVTHFRQQGHPSEYMRHAFEPRILEKLNKTIPTNTEFCFIGSINKGSDYHNKREQLIKQLILQTNLQIWSNIYKPSQRDKQLLPVKKVIYYLVKVMRSIPGSESILSKIPKINQYVIRKTPPDISDYIDPTIEGRSHPSLFGLAMYQQIYQSKIIFNNHIDIAAQFASNMRLYEATGGGSCLLTDWQSDLSEIFEPEREVVTYRSVEEAVEKVKYLLEHEEERQVIAKAGQARTLRDHTFEKRALQLDGIIKKAIISTGLN